MDRHKALRLVGIKDAVKGIVELRFATFNEKDHDGDVTLPGAFEDGNVVPVSAYNHASWEGALPVGTATISQDSKHGKAVARFFMDTPHGAATFQTVKALHEQGLGEWSYGYEPKQYDFGEWTDGSQVRFLHKQHVFEISPVLRGAGRSTATLSARGRKKGESGDQPGEDEMKLWTAISPHSTKTSTSSWDAADVVLNIPEDASVSDLRSVYAYCDPTCNPESKSAYLFPHHEGIGGPANIRACVIGIAMLNGKMFDQLDEQSRRGVWSHLSRHIEEAGRKAPELRTGDEGAKLFQDELAEALAGVSSVIDSAQRVVALRATKGKGLSQINTELLEWLDDDMRRLRSMFTTGDEEAHAAFLLALRDHPDVWRS